MGELSVGARQGSKEGLVIKSKEVWSDQLHTANVTREGRNNQACYAMCAVEHNLKTVDTRGTLGTVSTQVSVSQIVVGDQSALSQKRVVEMSLNTGVVVSKFQFASKFQLAHRTVLKREPFESNKDV